jgi:hypothetical protein
MANTVTLIKPGGPVDLNVAVTTPHVVAYKFWTRPGDSGGWVLLAQGSTPPDGVFHTTFPAQKMSEFFYWLGIGNFHGSSVYAVTLTLGQDGQHLDGGTIPWNGKTDAAGNDVTQGGVRCV